MNKKTILGILAGALLVAMTLGVTPAAGGNSNHDPCLPNGTESTTDGRLGILPDPCCDIIIGADAGAALQPHPCLPCLPPGDTLQVRPDPCDPCGNPGGVQPAGVRPCPKPDPCERFDLQAKALEGGDIYLSWNLPPWARGVIIVRDDGNTEEVVAILPQPADEYLDQDTQIGQAYAYWVQVHHPDGRGEPAFVCHIEVTAVPVFGTVVATGLAAGLGLLAYVGVRRRF